MGSAFTEKERLYIEEKLKEAAVSCLGQFGLKKTSVAQLAEAAGISKGAFYLFYDSKESLCFEVLEAYQRTLVEQLRNQLADQTETEQDSKEVLICGLTQLFDQVAGSFLIQMLRNNELELLMRKLPPERLKAHEALDAGWAELILSHLGQGGDPELFSTALRALFMTMVMQEAIGEKYPAAMALLIRGLVNEYGSK